MKEVFIYMFSVSRGLQLLISVYNIESLLSEEKAWHAKQNGLIKVNKIILRTL